MLGSDNYIFLGGVTSSGFFEKLFEFDYSIEIVRTSTFDHRVIYYYYFSDW